MTFFKSKKFIIISIILAILVITNIVTSALGPSASEASKFNEELSYRSNLGKCPTRPAGTMALLVVKTFEQSHPLRDVKLKILNEKWADKYFVSDYKIQYDPYSIYNSMGIMVQTAGLIWFVRGTMLLVQSSDPGSEGGPKGLVFVIAGILAMNFGSTVSAVNYIVGRLLSLTGLS